MYELNVNDCRHYVNELVQEATGVSPTRAFWLPVIGPWCTLHCVFQQVADSEERWLAQACTTTAAQLTITFCRHQQCSSPAGSSSVSPAQMPHPEACRPRLSCTPDNHKRRQLARRSAQCQRCCVGRAHHSGAPVAAVWPPRILHSLRRCLDASSSPALAACIPGRCTRHAAQQEGHSSLKRHRGGRDKQNDWPQERLHAERLRTERLDAHLPRRQWPAIGCARCVLPPSRLPRSCWGFQQCSATALPPLRSDACAHSPPVASSAAASAAATAACAACFSHRVLGAA
jgi:hypothetical protein